MLSMTYWISVLAVIPYTYVLVSCYNTTLTEKKQLKIKDYLIIMCIAIIIPINNLYNQIGLIIPVTFIIVMFLFRLIFRESILKIFYKTLYLYFMLMLIEFMLLIGLTATSYDIEELNSQIWLKNAFSLLVTILLYLMFKINFIKWASLRLTDYLDRNKQIVYLTILIFILVGYSHLVFNLNFTDISFYITSVVGFVSIGILAYFYLRQRYNNQLLKLRNAYLEENLELVRNGLEHYRECKHNIINDFIFIKTLCDEEAQALINVKMEKYYKDYEVVNVITEVPKGFQGIVFAKSMVMDKYNINFVLTSEGAINYRDIGHKLYIDLCEVTSIVLDNAIEAAKEAEEKVIFFDIKLSKECIAIKVVNTFGNSIDVNKLGDRKYSTKKRDSGIGLNYIQKLNKSIKIEKEIVHELFVINVFSKIKK